MHCASCVGKVRSALTSVPDVESVSVTLDPAQAAITMRNHVTLKLLNNALHGVGAYSLSEESHSQSISISEDANQPGLKAYYPLLLVFVFLIGITTLVTLKSSNPGARLWMSSFMAAFFLAFSFFKLLDLKGFATSYSSYDIITKRWFTFGYIYPFIELGLGIGYVLAPMSLALSIATVLIMSVSIVGVIESVKNKRKIKCACLGTVFNLPMGTITIIEDALMIVMSAIMIGIYLYS